MKGEKKSLVGWVRKDNLKDFGKFGMGTFYSELILRPKKFIDYMDEPIEYTKVKITIEPL